MSQISFLLQEKDGTVGISYIENVKEISTPVKDIGETILNLVKEIEEKGYINYSEDGIFAEAIKKHFQEKLKEHKCCGGKCKQELNEKELKQASNNIASQAIEKTEKKVKCSKSNCCKTKNESFVSIEVDLVEEEISIGLRSNPAIDVEKPLSDIQAMALMIIDNLSKEYQIS
jgi:hypothetical protein